mgnify:CR=1 FL=1
MNGTFMVSLDFELFWGMLEVVSQESYRDNVLGGKKAIGQLLQLFETYGIHATWATVGFLFADNYEELAGFLPNLRPGYAKAELDGYAWQSSAPQSKLDFLLGVECALAMEAALKQVAEERGGTVQLSRFANGWQIAFRDKARPDIVRQIDEFYVRQPDERGRHVFDVIWTEMVRPVVAASEQ